MISVILPSYNRRRLTDRAVRSALAQTYHGDYEIVVVDDGSRPEEIYQPEDEFVARVRVVRHETNAGVSAARNTGVQAARGELVAFLDSDDTWLPNRLEDHAALFSAQGGGENLLVYSAYETTESNLAWTAVPVRGLRPGEAVGDYLLLHYGDLNILTWLGARALFLRFPFNPRLHQSEDWDVVLRMQAAGVRFAWSPRPAARRHADLRLDRLSLRPVPDGPTPFLQENGARLTPRARLIYEAIQAGRHGPPRSALSHFAGNLRFFARSPNLSPAAKLRLIFAYVAARVVHKLRLRWRRHPEEAGPSVL